MLGKSNFLMLQDDEKDVEVFEDMDTEADEPADDREKKLITKCLKLMMSNKHSFYRDLKVS